LRSEGRKNINEKWGFFLLFDILVMVKIKLGNIHLTVFGFFL